MTSIRNFSIGKTSKRVIDGLDHLVSGSDRGFSAAVVFALERCLDDGSLKKFMERKN